MDYYTGQCSGTMASDRFVRASFLFLSGTAHTSSLDCNACGLAKSTLQTDILSGKKVDRQADDTTYNLGTNPAVIGQLNPYRPLFGSGIGGRAEPQFGAVIPQYYSNSSAFRPPGILKKFWTRRTRTGEA